MTDVDAARHGQEDRKRSAEALLDLSVQARRLLNLPIGSRNKISHAVNGEPSGSPRVIDNLTAARAVVRKVITSAVTKEGAQPASFLIDGLMQNALAPLAMHGATKVQHRFAEKILIPSEQWQALITPIISGRPEPILASYLTRAVTQTDPLSQVVASRFVDFLLSHHSAAKFLELATRSAEANFDPDCVSREVFGKPIAVLDHEFRAFLLESHGASMSFAAFARRTAGYSTDCRHLWGALVIALVLQIAYAVTVPLSMNHLIDVGINANDSKHIERVLSILIAMFLLNAGATVVQDLTTAKIGARIMNRLRHGIYHKMVKLSDAAVTHLQPSGFISRFSSDMGVVEQAMSRAIPGSVKGIIGASLNVCLMFWIEWKLALVTFCILPVVILLPKLSTKRARRANSARQEVEAALLNFVQETVDLFKIIRAFGLSEPQRLRFSALAQNLESATFVGNAWRFIAGRLTDIGVSLVTLTVISVGTLLAYRGDLTIGEFAAFIGLLVNFGSYMSTLGEQVPYVIQGSTGLSRIDEVLDDTEETYSGSAPFAFDRNIEARDVVLSYTGGRTNLDGVSLEIPVNSSVAFVGESGSGKSSMVNLLMRFFDPDSGGITMDGIDIRDIDLVELRAQIALVPQDSVLFNASIRENIRMGRLDATDADIEAAARAAEAHDLITQMPEGYDSRAGHLGEALSGGQRQRIAIARALVRSPRILMLDEATSALDAGTASAIDGTLAKLRPGRTMIRVTHRLSSISSYDIIFVMTNGRIIERGSHHQLLQLAGHYKDLWDRQHEADAGSTQGLSGQVAVAE